MITHTPITEFRFEIEQHGQSMEDILSKYPSTKIYVVTSLENEKFKVLGAYFNEESMETNLARIQKELNVPCSNMTYTARELQVGDVSNEEKSIIYNLLQKSITWKEYLP